MGDIKAIETIYKGYRFRSRLEARWAVFFDALGVQYEYEPEGFQTSAGGYLPDFKVKCYGTRGDQNEKPFDLWIEVKGKMDAADAEKIKAFSNDGENKVLIVHRIPDENGSTDSNNCESYDMMDGQDIYPFNYDLIDGDYFAAYPAADAKGRFYLFGDDSSYIDTIDRERVERAYTTARQARFEHGEAPKIESLPNDAKNKAFDWDEDWI